MSITGLVHTLRERDGPTLEREREAAVTLGDKERGGLCFGEKETIFPFPCNCYLSIIMY